MVNTPQRKPLLKLHFALAKDIHMMSPNLNALDLMGMKFGKEKFSWKTTELQKEGLSKSSSSKNLKKTVAKKVISAPQAPAVVRPRYVAKSKVIGTFEQRIAFFDDEIAQIFGSLLLAFSLIVLVGGLCVFAGEFSLGAASPRSWLRDLFARQSPLLFVAGFWLLWANWLSSKFVRHS